MKASMSQKIFALSISVFSILFTCAFSANTVITITGTIKAEGQAILDEGVVMYSGGGWGSGLGGSGISFDFASYTITASAGPGGTISPNGSITVKAGDLLTFTITPDPGYELSAVQLDGAQVAGPSIYPTTYNLNDIQSDHTVTAFFSRYINYFGIQTGNRFEYSSTQGGVTTAVTDNMVLDTTSYSEPSTLDNGVVGPLTIQSWCEVLPDGISWRGMAVGGKNFGFDGPLPEFQGPISAGATWSATVSTSVYDIPVIAAISAKALPRQLVKVPAGYFSAWPVKYHFTVSGSGTRTSTTFTDYFAPYIGTVKSVTSNSTTSLTKFAAAGGTIDTPPPVVTGITPATATAGSPVTIKGYQFGATQGSSKVEIGGAECGQILSWSDTQIQCTVPEAAASGAVTVAAGEWNSNDDVNFTLEIPPSVASLTQSAQKGARTEVLAGQGFGKAPGKVLIGKTKAKIVAWSDSSVTFTVPAGMAPGVYTVTVTDSRGVSAPAGTLTLGK